MSEMSKYEPSIEGHYQQVCDRLAEYEGGDTVPRSDFEALRHRCEALEGALKRLATLGGGRSEGNCIAQEALSKIRKEAP